MEANAQQHYSPGERAILAEIARLRKELSLDVNELQQHLESLAAADLTAVEAVATRVTEAQQSLEKAIQEAKEQNPGFNATALEGTLTHLGETAAAIDAAKQPPAPEAPQEPQPPAQP